MVLHQSDSKQLSSYKTRGKLNDTRFCNWPCTKVTAVIMLFCRQVYPLDSAVPTGAIDCRLDFVFSTQSSSQPIPPIVTLSTSSRSHDIISLGRVNYTTLHYTTQYSRLHYNLVHKHYKTLQYITLHYISPQHSTIQYSTEHYSTVQYTTARYNTVHYSTVQYSTLQHGTIQYTTARYNTIQYSTVQYSTLQHGIIQYNTARYNTVHYSTVQYSTLQHGTIQYTTARIQYTTARYNTVHYSTVQYSTLQHVYSTLQHGTIQYRTLQYPTLYLQPMIPPKRFDMFSPITGGRSEGLGAFSFSFKKKYTKLQCSNSYEDIVAFRLTATINPTDTNIRLIITSIIGLDYCTVMCNLWNIKH